MERAFEGKWWNTFREIESVFREEVGFEDVKRRKLKKLKLELQDKHK